MLIRDCMCDDTTSVTPEMPLTHVVELLARHDVDTLPIVDADRHVVGCLSAHNLCRLLSGGNDERLETPVIEVADDDVPAVRADEKLETAASILFEHPRIEALPVQEKGKLVGTVSRHKVAQSLARLTAARIRSARALPNNKERGMRKHGPGVSGFVGAFDQSWNTDAPDPCIFIG